MDRKDIFRIWLFHSLARLSRSPPNKDEGDLALISSGRDAQRCQERFLGRRRQQRDEIRELIQLLRKKEIGAILAHSKLASSFTHSNGANSCISSLLPFSVVKGSGTVKKFVLAICIELLGNGTEAICINIHGKEKQRGAVSWPPNLRCFNDRTVHCRFVFRWSMLQMLLLLPIAELRREMRWHRGTPKSPSP